MIDYGHGGDVYRYGNDILDFSANINPLGTPVEVLSAFRESDVCKYPDPYNTELRNAISDMTGADPDRIICGNGAASLIFTLSNALRPRKTLIAAPSFSEYERAVKSVGSEIAYYDEKENILPKIENDVDMIFVCNPNNPTGTLKQIEELEALLERASEAGAFVLLDECFNDFIELPEKYSAVYLTEKYKNLAVLRSFTKMYAIPGLRLGYMICSDRVVLERIYSSRQAWEVSAPAEAAGIAACMLAEHCRKTRAYIKEEREYMTREFARLGIKYREPSANFIFFYHKPYLKQILLRKGILIRSCSNYVGLDDGCFRAAVRLHSENMTLIKSLEEFDG